MDETENKADSAAAGHVASQTAVPVTPLEVSDNELIASVLAGDETAFELLFNRYRLQVGRVAARFFNRREQVEEIVQESFIKAYFALKDYSGRNEKSFAAWLTRIAINTCYDELRRARRQPETTHSDLNEAETVWLESRLRAEDYESDVESATVSRDLAGKLLARLGAEDRLVLTLLNAEELSVAEIAEMTGWSIAKVKVRAHRARAVLRKALRKLL